MTDCVYFFLYLALGKLSLDHAFNKLCYTYIEIEPVNYFS